MNGLVDIHGDASVIAHPGKGLTFFTESKRLKGGSFGPTPSKKKLTGSRSTEIAYWGLADNQWPQQVIKELNSSDILRPLIRKQAKMMVGQGLVYGTTTVNETTGQERMNVMRHLEIEQWLRRTNINLFLYEELMDWHTHGNIFPEFQMAYDGTVAGLFAQDAARCRLGVKDDLGRITKCHISGNWDRGTGIKAEDTITLPCLDPYYDVAEQIRKSKAARMIMPVRLLLDDNDYYGQAPWHGLIESGWLEVAKAIPKLKRYLMENMMFIRYHIEISSEYWPLAFPDWKELSPEKKKKKKDDVVEAFTKWATGMEKAGRTLMTEMLTDELAAPNGKRDMRSLWKINPIKLEIPTGAYIEDSQEADFHIVRAFMDPSLFGIAPGKDRNSAGSGSDKRMAHTHHAVDNHADAQLLLSPLDVVADVNGWHEKYGNGQLIKFWFKSYHAATLDRAFGAGTDQPEA